MTIPIKYIWDKNNLNTDPLSADLQDNGYANSAIPGSAEFNEFWRNISLLTAESHSTGDVRQTDNPTPYWMNSGWLFLRDGSIGSEFSGATLRANIDTYNLYNMYWENRPDIICPVAGGRGLSAAADFSANKALTIPQTSGRVFCNVGGSVYVASQIFGLNGVSLVKENLAKHTHNVTQQGGRDTPASYQNGANDPFRGEVNTVLTTTDGAEDGLNGTEHENRQPTVTTYFFIKL